MKEEKKKDRPKQQNYVSDQPVPVILGSGNSAIQLSEDQVRNLAEHFADSSRHEMY